MPGQELLRTPHQLTQACSEDWGTWRLRTPSEEGRDRCNAIEGRPGATRSRTSLPSKALRPSTSRERMFSPNVESLAFAVSFDSSRPSGVVSGHKLIALRVPKHNPSDFALADVYSRRAQFDDTFDLGILILRGEVEMEPVLRHLLIRGFTNRISGSTSRAVPSFRWLKDPLLI